MCSNSCEFEVTCFRPESNLGPYGLLHFLSAALSTTELWWRMNHRRSFRTLLKSTKLLLKVIKAIIIIGFLSWWKVPDEHLFCAWILIYLFHFIYSIVISDIWFCMLDVIIGRHTWKCQIRTHIHTETHTQMHTHKKKTKKKKEKKTRCNDNQQTTVTHFGENKRLHLESSKQKSYIISLWVIIKAIFTSLSMSIIQPALICHAVLTVGFWNHSILLLTSLNTFAVYKPGLRVSCSGTVTGA